MEGDSSLTLPKICSSGYLLPSRNLLLPAVKFGPHPLQRATTKQKMKRRVRRLDHLYHRLHGAKRITLLLSVIFGKVLPHIPGGVVVVFDASLRDHPGAAQEIGAERSRLDNRN